MPTVNTDPKDLRKLAADTKRAQADIAAAIKRVRSTLNGARWDDPVRRRFEQQLSEMERAITNFSRTAQESQTYLVRKAGELEAFLRT
jgi:uncharacterized protein YukE